MSIETKRAIQLNNLIAKEEKAREERLASLKARLEKEQAKVKEVKQDDEGVSEVIAQVEACAALHSISNQKLLDLIAKLIVGETAKVVYRRKREPKVVKVVVSPAAKKVVAKKK